MSWNSYLSFWQFEPNNVPTFESEDDLKKHLYSKECFFNSSRSGYIPWKMSEIAEEYKSSTLYSISRENTQLLESSRTPAPNAPVLLNSKEIVELIVFLNYVLERFEANPKEAMQFDCDFYTENDFLEQYEISKELEDPLDTTTKLSDDGNTPADMFAFLKLLKKFCESAQKNGNVIIYTHDSC